MKHGIILFYRGVSNMHQKWGADRVNTISTPVAGYGCDCCTEITILLCCWWNCLFRWREYDDIDSRWLQPFISHQRRVRGNLRLCGLWSVHGLLLPTLIQVYWTASVENFPPKVNFLAMTTTVCHVFPFVVYQRNSLNPRCSQRRLSRLGLPSWLCECETFLKLAISQTRENVCFEFADLFVFSHRFIFAGSICRRTISDVISQP